MKSFLCLSILMVGGSAAFSAVVTTSSDPILGVRLQGDTIALSTDTGTANSNSYPAGEGPQFTIDQNINTKYLNFGKEFTGIIVDPFNDLDPVKGLQLVTANDGPDRDPASFSIYGTNVSQSQNFSDYTAIVLNQPILGTDPGRKFESELIGFANTTVYDSYLVVFPTIRNSAGANSMQVAEIRLDTIPEPSTAGLVGLATLGFAAFRRRRS